MGFIKKGESYYDMLEDLKKEAPELMLSSELILPDEQIKGLKKIFKANISGRRFRTEEEKIQYEENMKALIEKIVRKLHDAKLGDKPGTITLAQSSGGSNDNVRTLFGAKSVPFAIIQLNNIAILEAIGEADNATFIGEIDETFKENIKLMGRNEIVNRGILCRVTHKKAEGGDYNFDSNHISDLIQYAVDYPDVMKAVIKKQCEKNKTKAIKRVETGESYATIPASSSTLKTFKGWMGIDVSNAEAEKIRITPEEVENAVTGIVKDVDKAEDIVSEDKEERGEL